MTWMISKALMQAYENSLCSLGQEAESLEATCSDGEPSAQLNVMPTPQAYLSPDRMMDFSRLSRSGMTFAPLTATHGADVLTWYLADFPARPIPRQLLVETLQMISGRKCGGSWQMSLPGTYLPRTSSGAQSTERQKTSKRWVTKPEQFPLPRATWVQTTIGSDIGYLHTPTVTANYASPSMQKWPSCRAFVVAFGKPDPINHEWLMGWPIGWGDLRSLETDKFQSWRLRHSPFLQEE